VEGKRVSSTHDRNSDVACPGGSAHYRFRASWLSLVHRGAVAARKCMERTQVLPAGVGSPLAREIEE
jgi:hypothetical protein